MIKPYVTRFFPLFAIAFLLLFIASCKKDKQTTPPPVMATPKKVGLYELKQSNSDNSISRVLVMVIPEIGTKKLNQSIELVFDTGSGGLVIDANEVLPSSMITPSGFNFTGDSTVVDGITITNQKNTIVFGDDANTTNTVYGNLAYANVTLGDQADNIVVKRIPFFLYYKVVNSGGSSNFDKGDFDVFGVSDQFDITFNNGVSVYSPLNYYEPGTGLTKGFKMPALGTDNFTTSGAYVPGVITLGLTPDDLSSSSGYTMTHLSLQNDGSYSPDIASTVTYNGKQVTNSQNRSQVYVLFDTGTIPYSYIQDYSGPNSLTLVPTNSKVTIKTNSGFNYTYTITDTDYITYVENPNQSREDTTIFGIEFFLENSFLLDYAHHTLGVKNN